MAFDEIEPTTPPTLHSAVFDNNLKQVAIFLKSGADIDSRGMKGKTCLQIAVEKGNFDVIKYLLDHKAFVDPVSTTALRDGYTPLHLAVEKRNSTIVRLLLDYGASINAMTNNSLAPIHIAIKRGHKKVIKVLLDAGANVNARFENGDSILYVAVDQGDVDIVHCILHYRPALNSFNNKAIVAALYSFCDQQKLISDLYIYGLRLNREDITHDLIFTSIRKGHFPIVADLLHNGINPHLELVPPLLPTKNKSSLLHFAVEYEWIDIVKLLLNAGAVVNVRDSSEKTPFLIAAEKNNLAMLKMLLNAGSDVNAVDGFGRSALHLTVLQKIRKVNKEGCEWISFNNKAKIIKWLLDVGVNIDIQTTNNGSSCLHLAAYRGLYNVISVLLGYDADVNLVNHRKLTALEYALECMRSLDDRRYIGVANYYRYRFASFCMEARTRTFRILQQHVHRMHRVGILVSPKNLSVNNGFYKLDRYFRNICDEETAALQETKIGNTNVTIFNFLTARSDVAASMMRNEAIVDGLKYPENLKKFPGYSAIIKSQLMKALELKLLNERCFKLFNYFFDELPRLPLVCLNNILCQFSLDDKQKMIDHYYK